MRAILLLWAIPLTFFWAWYGLSAHDISFGTIFFSRALHDVVFDTYARTLGVPAGDIPAMIAWACAFDTGIILAIAAFRWRARWLPRAMDRIGDLRQWIQLRQERVTEASQADQVLPAE
jgi:hypothetical protein